VLAGTSGLVSRTWPDESSIELFAFRIELLHAVALQRRKHGAFRHLNAFQEAIEAGVAAFSRFAGNGIDRTAKIVGHREHVAGKILLPRKHARARRSAVRRRRFSISAAAQGAVLQFLVFRHQLGQDLKSPSTGWSVAGASAVPAAISPSSSFFDLPLVMSHT
jgi:hypothetical protein